MAESPLASRWQLFRLLGEPARLRLLALAEREELSLGELAELLVESLPNVSRHAAPLRQAGLLSERRLGTRTFVRMEQPRGADALIEDALAVGRALCEQDGALARVVEVVRQRDARTREALGEPVAAAAAWSVAPEVPLYLMALRELIPARELAVDVCPADGAALDVLAPLFRRVVLLERSGGAVSRAELRAAARGYHHVEVVRGEVSDPNLRALVGGGADLVLASYVGARNVARSSLGSLGRLLRAGGRLVVLDAPLEPVFSAPGEELDGFEQAVSRRLPSAHALGTPAAEDFRLWSAIKGASARSSRA